MRFSIPVHARLRLSKSSTQPKKAPYQPRGPGQGQGPVYSIAPEKLLIYADRGLAVVNKPNGMIAQLADPSNYQSSPNVDTNIYRTFLEDLRGYLQLNEPIRTLHRIDKPTTGALALALSRQSAKDFSHQIRAHQVEKTYLALVCGDASSFDKPRGMISTQLECDDGWVRIPGAVGVFERNRDELPRPEVRGETWVKSAVSEYEVLASSPKVPLSLLRLRLHTGLKHQLRVHLAQYLRTPILGDGLYLNNRDPILKEIKNKIQVPWGLFLHSSRFSLHRYRPAKFRLTVGAPLPTRFVELCKAVGIPLDFDDATGGVWADDKKVRGADIVTPGDDVVDPVQELGGVWFGASRGPNDEQRR